MDLVWIVMRNGKVDEVFSREEAAKEHQRNLVKKWAITKIIKKELKSI
jgi:hypothetical protein